jgi:hypothetical protein
MMVLVARDLAKRVQGPLSFNSEMVPCDVPLEIHGLVKNACDLHGVIFKTVEKDVFAAAESAAAFRKIFPRPASGEKWIGHDAITG